jgi:hypothetical protein
MYCRVTVAKSHEYGEGLEKRTKYRVGNKEREYELLFDHQDDKKRRRVG